MTLERHMWYTNLALATLERLDNHNIGFVMANIDYILRFSSTWRLIVPIYDSLLKKINAQKKKPHVDLRTAGNNASHIYPTQNGHSMIYRTQRMDMSICSSDTAARLWN